MDPAKGGLSLPGWDESYTSDGLNALLEEYSAIDSERLWDNLAYFINSIIPACEECGVNMAIHPDDPPWDIFSLPRIVTSQDNLDRLLSLNKSARNGLTLCTGLARRVARQRHTRDALEIRGDEAHTFRPRAQYQDHGRA